MKEFLKEIKIEFKKINWTSKKKIIILFKTTFLATMIMTLTIFLFDNLFSQMVTLIINLF